MTLDDVIRGWVQWDALERLEADNEAGNLARLYGAVGDGLIVWRMFREYRRRGLPVPEPVLAKLDQWAQRLEQASGPREVAAAVEMTGSGGGAHGRARVDQAQRIWRIVSWVEHFKAAGRRPQEAYRLVAAQHGLDADDVKSQYSRWRRQHDRAAHDVLRMLGRR